MAEKSDASISVLRVASCAAGTTPRSFGGFVAPCTRPSRSRVTVSSHGPLAHMPPRTSTLRRAPGGVEATGAAHPATMGTTHSRTARIASGAHRDRDMVARRASRAIGSGPGRFVIDGAAYHRRMPVMRSRLDPRSVETRANHDAMAALVADLRARQAVVAGRGAGGDERSIARHRERGKLPVRERIERLLDPGSAFLELSPLAATGLYDDDAP